MRPSARRKTAVCLRFSSRADLLDPVRAAEQRVEGDERERHELGEAAGALLQRAHDAHVLGQLPRLLDVAEHHGHRRRDALGVARLDHLDPAGDRQLVGRDPLAHAVVEHLGRGARRRVEPGVAQPAKTSRADRPETSAHVGDLHRRVGVEVQRRRRLLDQPQPALVVGQRPVGMDPRLHADLGGAVVDGLVHARDELLAVVLVGVGRALALAEAAERAADDADVRDVDVAVDDERHRVPRQLGAQLVGGLAHVLDRLGSGLGEQRRQLLAAQRQPSRPRAIAPATRSRRIGRSARRPEPRRGMNDQNAGGSRRARPGRSSRDRCTGGRRRAARSARSRRRRRRLRTWWGEGNGCSGEMWSPLAERPPRSVAPAATSSGHQSDRLGGTWTPTSGMQPPALADQPHEIVDRDRAGPAGERVRRAAADPGAPVVGGRGRRRSPPARGRSSAGGERSSGGSPPGCGRGGRGRRRSPRARPTRSSSVSPMPTRMPRGERDPQLAGRLERRQAHGRVLGRRARRGPPGRG